MVQKYRQNTQLHTNGNAHRLHNAANNHRKPTRLQIYYTHKKYNARNRDKGQLKRGRKQRKRIEQQYDDGCQRNGRQRIVYFFSDLCALQNGKHDAGAQNTNSKSRHGSIHQQHSHYNHHLFACTELCPPQQKCYQEIHIAYMQSADRQNMRRTNGRQVFFYFSVRHSVSPHNTAHHLQRLLRHHFLHLLHHGAF